MSKKRKVNPNRIPISEAEYNRRRIQSTSNYLAITMFSLFESGADADFIQQFERKFKTYVDLIGMGKMTVKDVVSTVQEEYAEMLAKVDAEFWCLPLEGE